MNSPSQSEEKEEEEEEQRRKQTKKPNKIIMSLQHPDVPGDPTDTKTSLLESATATVQSFAPINKINQHLCAFHFYAHDMTRQIEAHHYCGCANDEFRQCLIYDSPHPDARLIGVEYIVSEPLFMTLPDNEKHLWHSHEYEVKSGVLFTPGVPGPVSRQDLEKVCRTYGKVFHFWQVDRGDSLPLGLPQVMMALTRDGQLYEELAKSVGQRYSQHLGKEKEKRAYMKGLEHGIHPLANGGGKGLTTELREVDCKPVDSVPRVFV